MRYRCYIPNAGNYQPGALKGSNGSLSARPRTLNKHINLTQAHIYTPASSLFGGPLCGEGRALTGTLKSHSAGAGGSDYIALSVGDANSSVVKRGINVRPSLGDDATFSAT
jgi:hypothetical protein